MTIAAVLSEKKPALGGTGNVNSADLALCNSKQRSKGKGSFFQKIRWRPKKMPNHYLKLEVLK